MFELLEKLRQKSEKTKKFVAFLSAFFVAGIIFVVWLSVLYPNWKYGQMKEAKVVSLQLSPVSRFGETFSTAMSSMGEQFSQIKNVISSFSSSTIYYNATNTLDVVDKIADVSETDKLEFIATSTER
jgi:hypothetical protein